jgi:hypothetical protein
LNVEDSQIVGKERKRETLRTRQVLLPIILMQETFHQTSQSTVYFEDKEKKYIY